MSSARHEDCHSIVSSRGFCDAAQSDSALRQATARKDLCHLTEEIMPSDETLGTVGGASARVNMDATRR